MAPPLPSHFSYHLWQSLSQPESTADTSQIDIPAQIFKYSHMNLESLQFKLFGKISLLKGSNLWFKLVLANHSYTQQPLLFFSSAQETKGDGVSLGWAYLENHKVIIWDFNSINQLSIIPHLFKNNLTVNITLQRKTTVTTIFGKTEFSTSLTAQCCPILAKSGY